MTITVGVDVQEKKMQIWQAMLDGHLFFSWTPCPWQPSFIRLIIKPKSYPWINNKQQSSTHSLHSTSFALMLLTSSLLLLPVLEFVCFFSLHADFENIWVAQHCMYHQMNWPTPSSNTLYQPLFLEKCSQQLSEEKSTKHWSILPMIILLIK